MTTFELEFDRYPDERGPLSVAPVPWDAEVLGFPVFELRLHEVSRESDDALDRWLRETAPQRSLVFSKVEPERVSELQALAARGFYPVETALELRADLSAVVARESGEGPRPVRLRRAGVADLDRLKAIAGSAFWADRFHMDPNVSDAAADDRYVRWIERALRDDELLFAYERTDDQAVIGFYLIRAISEESVDLNLVALDKAVAGQGFGRALYELTAQECLDLGFSEARTKIVAHNLAALNVLTSLGFSACRASVSMHRFSSGRVTA